MLDHLMKGAFGVIAVSHLRILNGESCYKALVPGSKVNDCLRECLPVFITWQLPESTHRDLFVGRGEQSEPLQSLLIVWSGSKQPRFKIFIFRIGPPNPSHTAKQPRSTSHQPFLYLIQWLSKSLQCRHKHRDNWQAQTAIRRSRKIMKHSQ